MFIVRWVFKHILDFVFGTIFALFIAWLVRRIGILSVKLGENAVLGSIDDRIADYFGLTAPVVINFLWQWCVPPLLAMAAIWAYHVIKSGEWSARRGRQKLLGLVLAAVGGLMLLAGVGFLVNTGTAGQSTSAEQRVPNTQSVAMAQPETKPAQEHRIKYVSDLRVSMNYVANPSPQPVIVLTGTHTKESEGKKLDLYVDIAFTGGMGIPAPIGDIPFSRMKIATFDDNWRTKPVNQTLVTRVDGPNNAWIFKWNTQSPDQATITINKTYVARVAFREVGKPGQYLYFMLIPHMINERPYLDVLSVDNFNFVQRWEAQDAAK